MVKRRNFNGKWVLASYAEVDKINNGRFYVKRMKHALKQVKTQLKQSILVKKIPRVTSKQASGFYWSQQLAQEPTILSVRLVACDMTYIITIKSIRDYGKN